MKNQKEKTGQKSSLINVERTGDQNTFKSLSSFLPIHADKEHIKVMYENGLLSVHLPTRRAS